MPCESSSGWGYSANSIYPIRQGVVMKSRPEGLVPFFAPDYEELKDHYEIAWDINSQDLYKMYGIIQKFTCQGISADTYLDFSKLEGGKVPMTKMMQDMLFSMKIGMKTHYYVNSKTENKSGEGAKESDADCLSCKL
jgi:ribonucleoside-diphosphate reductase alpha chain